MEIVINVFLFFLVLKKTGITFLCITYNHDKFLFESSCYKDTQNFRLMQILKFLLDVF